MTETTRSAECSAAGATLYVAFELGSKQWTLAFATSPAQRPRLRRIGAGDLGAVEREVALATQRFGLASAPTVRSCYEAGRDGFWVHRAFVARGISNVVVDSSSIEVKRRARQAKTDRLDAGKLLQLLMRWTAGERPVWSVVHVPSVEAEAARQLARELATVRTDRVRVRNRIQGLLASQGIRTPLTRNFSTRLATLQTGDGRPLPAAYGARLTREWAHLRTIEQRLRALAAERTAVIATGTDRVAEMARGLVRLRAIGPGSALLFSGELFATRTFRNPRQLGALTGLVPVPYRSGQYVADQGISRGGRGELRRVSIQLAWGWLRHQSASGLTRWFEQRFAHAGGRARRIGIVAVARKLIILLWRFVTQGVIPDGVELKPAEAA